jgi:L-rhamnose mutarotase
MNRRNQSESASEGALGLLSLVCPSRSGNYYEPKESPSMKRYGSVIRIRPEAVEEYKRQHANVWPEVLDMIRRCNITNYSIYLKDDLLFGYWEYHGSDFEADMAKMAADPKTQEWWKLVGPMQRPLETRAPGEWWASMEEVFHFD